MISERTLKKIVAYVGMPSVGLGVMSRLMPAGPAHTVLGWIGTLGIVASGMAIAYNAIARTNRCP